ncbi:MAG TPA: hypothetical protein VHZ55_29620 [Bryobacteraceae bacterium]|nr:hypothetical protein [Bryobacteraceae bacterium]
MSIGVLYARVPYSEQRLAIRLATALRLYAVIGITAIRGYQ